MLKLLRKTAGYFSLVIFFYIINSIIPILLSYTNGRLVDTAYNGEIEIFWKVLLTWTILFISDIILEFLFNTSAYIFDKKAFTELQKLAFNRLFSLEKGIFNTDFNTSHRIFLNDFNELLPHMYRNINLSFSIIRSIIDLSVLIAFNYIFGLGVTFLIILFIALPTLFNVKLGKMGIVRANIDAEIYSRYSNLIDGYNILITSNKSSKLVEINNKIWGSIRKFWYSMWVKVTLYREITSLIYSLFNVLVIISAFAFVYMGWFSLGSLIFARSLAVGSLKDGYGIIRQIVTIFLKKPIVKDYYKLARESEKLRKKQITNLEKLREIQIKNVSFSYERIGSIDSNSSNLTRQISDLISNNKVKFQNFNVDISDYSKNNVKVVDSLSLKIKQGRKILITGKSGLGKTTISRLLLNYIKPISGEIFWNKTNYSQLSIYDIREKIAYISGNFSVFEGSVKENLVLEREGISKTQLIEILNKLSLNNFKLEEKISQDTISSGQNQRFIIARELLAPREIIIFDEAMANIDPENRQFIEDMLLNNPELTFINITHHLKSKERYDEIIDLNENKHN